MMKKFLTALLVVGTLGLVSSADAKRCGKPACAPKVCAPKVCAPKCTTTERFEDFYTPCTKMVEVKGQCKNQRCIKTTTCVSESEKCIGGCEGGCENGVTAADRGQANRGAAVRRGAVDANYADQYADEGEDLLQ